MKPNFRYSYKAVPGYPKEARIFVRSNKLETEDGFIQLGSKKTQEFYSVGNIVTDFAPTANEYVAQLTFVQDTRVDTYERAVFGVFDLTGQIGGLYEIFEIFGALFIGYFSEKLFYFSLFSKIYKTYKAPSQDALPASSPLNATKDKILPKELTFRPEEQLIRKKMLVEESKHTRKD